MATVNAQSVEDFADRIVYRYSGGRYEQTLTTPALSLSTGLKTLLNTDTSRSYVVPASGIPSRFYKVELKFYGSFQINEDNRAIGPTLVPCEFFQISIPSLNYDGRALQTIFSAKSAENMVTSAQLRAVNIGNIQAEPMIDYSIIQNTALSRIQFDTSLLVGLRAVIEFVVTCYRK